MNTKKILLTVMLLSSLLGGAGYSSVLAAAKTYALWCEGNKTVYYVYGETAYAAGGTYDGQTITKVYDNKITAWDDDCECEDMDWDVVGKIKKVVFDASYSAARPTDLSWFFAEMGNLTTIVGLNYLNTSQATTLEGMFDECRSLTEINGLDHFNTSNVTKMSYMFYNCVMLTSIDVSHFNTTNVQDMTSMFCQCEKLVSLDLSTFNTSNVTTLTSMFSGCTALKSINLSSFDTSNVTDMSYMFSSCPSLESLDVSNFDTHKVTNMTWMFQGCSLLKSLDLHNFNTTNVGYMANMFNDCSELATIYCNDSWSATISKDMFKGCTKLVGAIPYNSTKVTVEYANPATGYFTKIVVKMSFSSPTAIVTYGEDFTPPALTKTPDDIEVTYESSDPSVAEVDASTGALTLKKSGSTTITAKFAGNSKFEACSASYTLTVKAAIYMAIGGTQVTSDNAATLTETLTTAGLLTSGTAALAVAADNSMTLTLTDAVISASNTGISNSKNLTIAVNGNCQVTTTSDCALINKGTLTLSGTGTLKLTGYRFGIENENSGTVILSGPTVEASGMTISVYGSETSTYKILGGTLIAAGAERATIETKGTLELGPGVVISQPAGAWWDSTNHILSVTEGYSVRTQVIITGNAAANDLKFASPTATAKMGADFTAPALTNPHNLAVTYTSSKTDVAEVDASTGKVTLKKPGETTITASFAGSADYLAGSVSYTLTVSKGDVTLAYSAATASVVFGAELSAPTLTVTPESLKGSVKITSSNTAVAKITGLGDVTVVGAGETTIKAAFAGDDYYNAAEASYKLTVTAAAATLTFAQTDCSTTVGASFNSPTLSTTPSSLKVKYTSSDPDLATVSEETGVVVAKSEGVVTITATSADVSYTGSASYKLTITRNSSGLQFASATATATYGSAFTAPDLKNEHGLTVKYESSNTAVATVDETSGKVTLLKGGETTITARFAGNDEYEPASASYVLTVKKAKATLTFSQTECKAAVRRDFKAPKLTTNPDGLTVKYTSSDPSVANVNEITGFVVALAKGEATITATVVNDQYEGSASYKLTVIDPIPGDANTDFKLSADDIMAIVEDMLGYRPEGFDTYMSDMNGDNNFNIADIIKIVNAITGN